MSKSTYVVLAAVLAVATACTSGSAPQSAAPPVSSNSASSAPADCLASLSPAYVSTAGPRVAFAGSGRVTVVLANESDEDECAWTSFAQHLMSSGYRVALFDYAADPVQDVTTAAAAARAHGAAEVVLAGASEGAKASILAAAQVKPAAVVSLSAEAQLQGTDVAPAARALDVPVFYATAADDPYGATEATRGFARGRQLVVVPGAAHGIALLRNEKVSSALDAFLAESASPSDPALTCGAGAATLSLPGPSGFRIDGLALGSGPTTVVFLHELGQAADACGWWPFAYWLTHHYPVRAVLINRCDAGATACPTPLPAGDELVRAEVGPAVTWARAHGARRVVLAGASAGGGDALQASAVLSGIDAVVDLSGDQTSTGFSVQRAAARVRVPTYMAVATHDRNCPVSSFRRQYAAVPAGTKRLKVVDDRLGRHGWDLVFGVGLDRTALAAPVADWIVGHYG